MIGAVHVIALIINPNSGQIKRANTRFAPTFAIKDFVRFQNLDQALLTDHLGRVLMQNGRLLFLFKSNRDIYFFFDRF